MRRLFWKLFVALWGSIMAFALIASAVNLHFLREEYPESPEVVFNRGIQRTEALLAERLREGGVDAFREAMHRLPHQVRNHIFLFDSNGQEILGRNDMNTHLEEMELHHSLRTLQDAQGHVFKLAVLRRMPPPTLFSPDLRGLIHRLVLAALLSAIVSYFLARYLTRPLDQLGAATRRLSSGDLEARLSDSLVRRHDEFGELAREFDDMAGHLQQMQTANQRLLRDVSHELRSPLARLSIAMELARSRTRGEIKEELDRIELETKRLQELVDEVLDLLRESSESFPLKPEDFNLADLLEDVRTAVEYELPEGAAGIGMQVEAELPVRADRELLWRALENLLRNALSHGEGKKVELRARRASGGAVEIDVMDRGPGVPEEQLQFLFTPFFRVHEDRARRTGGHGLGLAIASAAVRRHKGTIEAYNRASGGLGISIRLPRLQAD